MQIKGRALVVGAALFGATTLGLAAPASANTTTPTPTVADCESGFAATALQALRTFQASNKAPEAVAVLRGGLTNAELGFTVCLASVLQ